MKWLRSGPRRSRVATALTLLMLLPYLAWSAPARAQRGTISVYMLDFNNKTKVGGQLLGQVAAAQVSLQLNDSLTWEVVPEAQVAQRIQALNLKPPFDRVDRVKIANGVDSSAVVYGSIDDARVSGGANPQAFVRITVLVEDILSGVLINGAVAEGQSTRRMGFTGDADVLLEEALGKAAFKAREFMDRFRLPEGTVLNTTVIGAGSDTVSLDALLNVGARQGVRKGMEMIVTRLREPVGRMKITDVDSDVSTGRVVENTQGVRPEDRVRAIFNFADFPITRSRRAAVLEELPKVAAAGTNGPLLASTRPGEGGAVRIARAAKEDTFVQLRNDEPASASQATVGVPPPVVVDEPEVERTAGGGSATGKLQKVFGRNAFKMLVGGLLIVGVLAIGGRAGTAATRPHAVSANGFQQQVGAPGAFIRVCWDRPKSVLTSQVLQYVIWRADVQGDFRIVGAMDTDAIKCFVDSEATRTVNAFSGDPGADDAGSRTAIQNVPGITSGLQFRYQVATAYHNGLEDRDGDQTPDDADFMSPLSMTSPWITAISPPAITQPTVDQQVSPDQVAVSWQQSPGANQYIVWVSTSPAFPSGRRVAFGPFTTLPVDQGGPREVSRTIDTRKGVVSGKRTLYISVGARNSQDAVQPRPFGAIFSAPVLVHAEIIPPPPPGGAASQGKRARGEGRKGKGAVLDGGKNKGR